MDIFTYSIGLAMTLTGFNMLVDLFPEKWRTKIKAFIVGIFFIVGFLLMAYSLDML